MIRHYALRRRSRGGAAVGGGTIDLSSLLRREPVAQPLTAHTTHAPVSSLVVCNVVGKSRTCTGLASLLPPSEVVGVGKLGLPSARKHKQ